MIVKKTRCQSNVRSKKSIRESNTGSIKTNQYVSQERNTIKKTRLETDISKKKQDNKT